MRRDFRKKTNNNLLGDKILMYCSNSFWIINV